MKRLVALALAGWCVLASCPRADAQSLKERSLSDSPAESAPAKPAMPAQKTQPAAATSAPQPAAATAPAPQPVESAPQPARPAPAAPQPPAMEPQPMAAPAPGTPPPPPPPPPGEGTRINGQPVVAPPPPPPPPAPRPSSTFKKEEVDREVQGFFEGGSRGLAEMVARAFKDLGQPSGFIKGNEGGGALVVGLRYGTGTLYLKGQRPVPVYWQSPSLGFDLGVNAVKVFTLVYGMTRPEEIFQRYPGVDGSAYILGGFGMNYQRSEGITLAPIRFGVGLRLGANVGYQHYTRTQDINPF